MRIPSLIIFASLFLGCAPRHTFDLTITNHTQDPLTIGIVKDGPPYETDLATPDEWALRSSLDTLPPWGHVIPPGRTIDSPRITGTFPQGVRAYLRAYRGEHSNAGLIAIGNSSPDRAEILLFPGPNQITIHEDKNGLRAQRQKPTELPK